MNIPHSIVAPSILFDELEVKRGEPEQRETAGVSAAGGRVKKVFKVTA